MNREIIDLYKEKGAFKEGHFLLSSGVHTPGFLQSATVLQYPDASKQIATAMAAYWTSAAVDFVIGPAMGGVVLAAALASELGVRALFAEKSGDSMFIRQGLTVNDKEKFIAVEDVLTTGASVLKAIHAAERAGAECIGVSAIFDRSHGKLPFDYPFKALAAINIETYQPEECPLCRQGIPLEKI